jgi:hypothetical protein
MKASRRVTMVASFLLLFCLVATVFSRRRVEAARPTATLDEVLFFNSPKMLKRMSLGYDGLIADLYWTRAVQYFGAKHHDYAMNYDLLSPLLTLTTALDPELKVAYHFGANFLGPKPPEGAGRPDQAIELIEFGIKNNPNDWKLYYDLGFIYYLELKDYSKAAEAFEWGTKVPNAHPFLKIMAAQMAGHAGETETARMLWTAAYQNTEEKQIKANAIAHLRALRVDEDVTALEKAVAAYQGKNGKLPPSIAALEISGSIERPPLDPTGRTYKLMPDGRIEVRVPEALPFIEKGLPPGYKPGPPKLDDLEK